MFRLTRDGFCWPTWKQQHHTNSVWVQWTVLARVSHQSQATLFIFLKKVISITDTILQSIKFLCYTISILYLSFTHLVVYFIEWYNESNPYLLNIAAPSGPPVGFVGTARSPSEIITQWQPPPEEHRNGQILGYIIRYRLFGYNDSPWTNKNITNEVIYIHVYKWANKINVSYSIPYNVTNKKTVSSVCAVVCSQLYIVISSSIFFTEIILFDVLP